MIPADVMEADWVLLGDNLATLQMVRQAAGWPLDTVLGLAHAVAGGFGIGYLPCLIGDRWPGLIRPAPPEPDFASDL